MTTSAGIQALFQQGKRIDKPSMTVLWRLTDGSRRAGFAVSRHIGHAVHRNRARRRLREAFRAARDAAPAGVDLVVVGKPRALDAPFTALVGELREALATIAGPRPRA